MKTAFAWTSFVNAVSAVTGAAHLSTCGLAVNIASNSPSYVYDTLPANETIFRERFYFNPGTLAMDKNDTHLIYAANNGAGGHVLAIEFKWTGSAYQLRAGIRLDNGQLIYTGWTTVTKAWHSLELYWKASTTTKAKNGLLTFWIDGSQKAALTAIDNDTTRIESSYLGAVEGIDSQTRGVAWFDKFISARMNYIGP